MKAGVGWSPSPTHRPITSGTVKPSFQTSTILESWSSLIAGRMSGGRSSSATAWSGGVTAEGLVQVDASLHAWHGRTARRNHAAWHGSRRSAASLGPGLDHLVKDVAQQPRTGSVVSAVAGIVGADPLATNLLGKGRVEVRGRDRI